MADVVQLGATSESLSLSMRVRYGWSADDNKFETVPEFLGVDGNPLGISRSLAFRYRSQFSRRFPVFYLSALRDVSREVDGRSGFWGELLRVLEIPPKMQTDVAARLRLINDELLRADKRLGAVSKTLAEAARIASSKGSGEAGLEIDGLTAYELLAKTGIRLRAEELAPWIPIRQQGQGVQSLSVLFLFKTIVDHVLATDPVDHPEPVLLLEEPETHLHPQAVRSMWHYIKAQVPGQKLITSHSTHFLQDVSFRDIRFVIPGGDGTTVEWLRTEFSVSVQITPSVAAYVDSNATLRYDGHRQSLIVQGKLPDKTYRKLCSLADSATHQSDAFNELRKRSSQFVSDSELATLERYIKRTRCECLFASGWILVEGPTDRRLIRAMAQGVNTGLDEHGVSVIDVKQNANANSFVILATALGIEWVGVFDGDRGGAAIHNDIQTTAGPEVDLSAKCREHSNGDLEAELVTDELVLKALRDILQELGKREPHKLDRSGITNLLRSSKSEYAELLAKRFRNDRHLAERGPEAFLWAINQLCS